MTCDVKTIRDLEMRSSKFYEPRADAGTPRPVPVLPEAGELFEFQMVAQFFPQNSKFWNWGFELHCCRVQV